MFAHFNSLFQRRVVDPVIHLLRMGASPRRLAWSLAVGIAVGVNPLLGSTTVLSLLVAFFFRLNLVASQIATHLMYPIQLALFFAFIDLGDHLFHTGPLPLSRHDLLHAARYHPLALTRQLWPWEWHALLVWLLASIVGAPLLVALLTPVFRRLLLTLQQEQPTP